MSPAKKATSKARPKGTKAKARKRKPSAASGKRKRKSTKATKKPGQRRQKTSKSKTRKASGRSSTSKKRRSPATIATKTRRRKAPGTRTTAPPVPPAVAEKSTSSVQDQAGSEESATQVRSSARVAFVVYFAVIAFLLVQWFGGIKFLLFEKARPEVPGTFFLAAVGSINHEFFDPAYPVRVLLVLGVVIVVAVLAFVYRKRIGNLLRPIRLSPTYLRTLIVLLPFYFVLSRDLFGSLLVAVIAALGWLAQKRVAPLLNRVPATLIKTWPLILYALLATRGVYVSLLLAIPLLAITFIEPLMLRFFEPVWNWLKGLPNGLSRGIRLVRLSVAATMPVALSFPKALTVGPKNLPGMPDPSLDAGLGQLFTMAELGARMQLIGLGLFVALATYFMARSYSGGRTPSNA